LSSSKILIGKEINELIPQALQEKYKLTLPGLAMFLAQCDHESQGFSQLEENLNYSANRLLAIFPKYFTENTVSNYANNPERIGNYVYANRMGNGSLDSGDGYRYRGRGYLQLTGKDNYKRCGTAIDVDLVNNPNILLLQEYALQSALWYFADKRLINDLGSSFNKTDLDLRSLD
jgi:putative chitinase